MIFDPRCTLCSPRDLYLFTCCERDTRTYLRAHASSFDLLARLTQKRSLVCISIRPGIILARSAYVSLHARLECSWCEWNWCEDIYERERKADFVYVYCVCRWVRARAFICSVMTRCSQQTTPCRRIYGWIFNGIGVKGQQIIASENGDMELFSAVCCGARRKRAEICAHFVLAIAVWLIKFHSLSCMPMENGYFCWIKKCSEHWFWMLHFLLSIE